MRQRRKLSNSETLEGARLSYNAGIQANYVSAVKDLLNPMIEEVSKDVIKFFEKPLAREFIAQDASIASQAKILTDKLTKKFEQLFGDKTKPIAEKMVKQSSVASAASLERSLKKLSGGVSLKTDILTGPLKEVLKASVNENVELIKSIGNDYLSNVKKQVMRSITTGNGLADLIPALSRYKGITNRHAKNMALDQTRKVYNQLNQGRLEARGLNKFKWLHSGGGQKPRKDHIAMNGKIFSFDDPPIIDQKTGERGIPGQAINCGCTMTPVITLERGL